MPRQIIALSEKAITRIHQKMDEDPTVVGLCVHLEKGGCAGVQYHMDWATQDTCADILTTHEAVKEGDVCVFLRKDSILFLLGATLDVEETPFSTTFIFQNPNQVDACGCGESVVLQQSSHAS